MPQIYISYRRADSENIARRLYQQLLKTFDVNEVMIDQSLIKPGDDWREALQAGLDRCDTMLVLIGPNWLTVTNGGWQPRLWVDDDWVRYEVEYALGNQPRVRLIPVLVRNAHIPAEGELPESIRDIAYLYASPIRDGANFFADVTKLVEAIRQGAPAPMAPTPQSSDDQPGGGHDNVEQNVDSVSGGVLIGSVTGNVTVNPGGSSESEPPPAPPPEPPEEKPWYQNPQVLVAIIGGIVTIIAALITIVPPLMEQAANVTETVMASVLTETQAEILTETVTQVVSPTNAPTNMLPTFTPVPTITRVTPTSDTTSSDEPLSLIRDDNSLTLYVPKTESALSLVGFTYQVTLSDGQSVSYRLNTDFAGFRGIPFANIESLERGLCFRLVLSRATRTAPLECQSNVLLLTQDVVLADRFWHDDSTGIDPIIFVYREDQQIETCVPESECKIDWPPVD